MKTKQKKRHFTVKPKTSDKVTITFQATIKQNELIEKYCLENETTKSDLLRELLIKDGIIE